MLTGNPAKDHATVLKLIAHEQRVIAEAVAQGRAPSDVAVRSLARYQAQAVALYAAAAALAAPTAYAVAVSC